MRYFALVPMWLFLFYFAHFFLRNDLLFFAREKASNVDMFIGKSWKYISLNFVLQKNVEN